MKVTNYKIERGYPGFKRVTVGDAYKDIPPPNGLLELWNSWNYEEQQQFIAHYWMCTVSRIEDDGGFVCLPLDCDLLPD